jgi:hypothetical protein
MRGLNWKCINKWETKQKRKKPVNIKKKKKRVGGGIEKETKRKRHSSLQHFLSRTSKEKHMQTITWDEIRGLSEDLNTNNYMRLNKRFEWRFKHQKQNKLREKKRGGWRLKREDKERPKDLREKEFRG